jgi:hypothetical protein
MDPDLTGGPGRDNPIHNGHGWMILFVIRRWRSAGLRAAGRRPAAQTVRNFRDHRDEGVIIASA